MFCIYRAFNLLNKKSYVGFAVDLDDRKKVHFCEAYSRNSNFIFHKALRKYGKEAFVWGIVIEGANKDFLLKEMEPYYIKLFNTHYIYGHGYNMTFGGDGIFGYKFTNEQIKKLSESHKGKKHSVEERVKMSKAHSGKKNSISHNKNIAAAFSKNWMVEFPNGSLVEVSNLKDFCFNNNLRYSAMHRIAMGKMKQHRNFKCRSIENV